MAIPKLEPLAKAGPGQKNIIKAVLGGALVLLLAAFGLTASGNDFDIGKMLSGSSPQEARMSTDDKGNIIFDKEGNVTTDKSIGKEADKYNCDDFADQSKAQSFFRKVGGIGKDVNRLDGDKDGEACESLPKDASVQPLLQAPVPTP